uniref:FH2 domain containing 1 n=1 Tax=Peromyscus maniculatus bairdii TaxID=230844 RepID=A0A8C8TRX4_PERMB
MRSFFWKTIPEEQVRGKTNIWTLAAKQQHHYQIDKKTIEELFGQQEDTSKASLPRRGGALNSSFRDAREEVTVLDAKRSMNIGIFLKQFKKSPQSIVEDIHQGKSEHYGAETLREILKLLPESEEQGSRGLEASGADIQGFPPGDTQQHRHTAFTKELSAGDLRHFAQEAPREWARDRGAQAAPLEWKHEWAAREGGRGTAQGLVSKAQ